MKLNHFSIFQYKTSMRKRKATSNKSNRDANKSNNKNMILQSNYNLSDIKPSKGPVHPEIMTTITFNIFQKLLNEAKDSIDINKLGKPSRIKWLGMVSKTMKLQEIQVFLKYLTELNAIQRIHMIQAKSFLRYMLHNYRFRRFRRIFDTYYLRNKINNLKKYQNALSSLRISRAANYFINQSNIKYLNYQFLSQYIPEGILPNQINYWKYLNHTEEFINNYSENYMEEEDMIKDNLTQSDYDDDDNNTHHSLSQEEEEISDDKKTNNNVAIEFQYDEEQMIINEKHSFDMKEEEELFELNEEEIM